MKEIKWLVDRKSNLSIGNKLLTYKAVINPYVHMELNSGYVPSKSDIIIIIQSYKPEIT